MSHDEQTNDTPGPDFMCRLEAVFREVTDLMGELNGHGEFGSTDEVNVSDQMLTVGDRMLTVGDVAERLSLSRSEVYRRARGWPFAMKLSPKALRFSEA